MVNNLLIERVCRRVLKEYLSVSDEVLEMSEECFKLFRYTYENTDWDYQFVFGGMKSLMYKGQTYNLKAYPDFKLGDFIDTIEFRLYGYNKDEYTYEEYEELIGQYGLNAKHLIPDERKIVIYVPIPFDGIYFGKDLTYVKSVINHEINHALQSNHRDGGSYVTNAYTRSTMVNDYTGADSDEIKELMYYIRITYYALHPDEVDSKIQELYYQLAYNWHTDDYHDLQAYMELKEVIECYDFVKEAMIDGNSRGVAEIENVRPLFPKMVKNILGISVSNWNRHCSRGVKRVYKQLRRIVQRFRDEDKEGRFDYRADMQKGSE